ncbi:hypothetical protein SFC66_16590 [Terribacillus saccharophilus]|uniref:hypothetical protein n=1 Tax=Terribacillus saccharophilus TaxID=361277 RepID=UPI003981E813
MTASEWLQAQGLCLSDIDFIETVIANQAAHQQGFLNEKQLAELMHQHFPEKTYHASSQLSITDFNKLLQDNSIIIDGREIIRRYMIQGFCMALCNRMLTE